MSIRGDRERAEGMDVRGLVVDLHQNANPLERISVHLRGLARPLYARLFVALLVRSLAMINVHQKEILLADLQMICVSYF